MHRSLLTGIEKNTDARPLRLGSVVDQVGATSRISIEGANGVPTRPAWFKVRLGVGLPRPCCWAVKTQLVGSTLVVVPVEQMPNAGPRSGWGCGDLRDPSGQPDTVAAAMDRDCQAVREAPAASWWQQIPKEYALLGREQFCAARQ